MVTVSLFSNAVRILAYLRKLCSTSQKKAYLLSALFPNSAARPCSLLDIPVGQFLRQLCLQLHRNCLSELFCCVHK
ncbi:hypothetical protein MES4922_160246 [Mesorhizobium ventifaucium]|uniref:Secreted protein n=1 Tax=Mesorhizobium ventifaucium TaxID=666020 RepID=A0ABN8JIC1_9HYPH|nr:hypothetical protein MES4922_160246 [Mesorhizobium ventifaucium]